jgi:hypothetical protein
MSVQPTDTTDAKAHAKTLFPEGKLKNLYPFASQKTDANGELQ